MNRRLFRIYGACYDIGRVDAPAYAHRGLMLDTGRRFIPKAAVLRMVDAMAMMKMNVLHLHLADWCRYALESAAAPLLNRPLVGDQAGQYSKADLAEILDYANARGIWVYPEVDIPA